MLPLWRNKVYVHVSEYKIQLSAEYLTLSRISAGFLDLREYPANPDISHFLSASRNSKKIREGPDQRPYRLAVSEQMLDTSVVRSVRDALEAIRRH